MLRHASRSLVEAFPGTSALAGAIQSGASRFFTSFVRGGDPVPAAGLLAINTLRDNPGSTKQARRTRSGALIRLAEEGLTQRFSVSQHAAALAHAQRPRLRDHD